MKGRVRRLARCVQGLRGRREHTVLRGLCPMCQVWGRMPLAVPMLCKASKARLRGTWASSCGQWGALENTTGKHT